jgi:uncharacterized coiled-coil DUF342 family protein
MELVEELIEKRDRHNAEAEKHKRSRDRLNDETRGWVARRDELNAQAREFLEMANQHRSRRDELNDEVKEAKSQRDIWNRKVNELAEKLARKKREKMPRKGPTIGQLKKRLRTLEFQQMTSVLKPDKEKELIEAIAELQTEIKEKEAELEKDDAIRNLIKEAAEARESAEHHHSQVGQLAEDAQREHDSMVEIYEKSDAVRKEADKAQENFIKCKLQADEEHHKHIELIKQVHDFDKMLSGLRQKKVTVTTTAEKRTEREEAAEIY